MAVEVTNRSAEKSDFESFKWLISVVSTKYSILQIEHTHSEPIYILLQQFNGNFIHKSREVEFDSYSDLHNTLEKGQHFYICQEDSVLP